MEESGLSTLLVSKEENQFYLTGFHCDNCFLAVESDHAWLLTDFRYTEAAEKAVSQDFEVVLLDREYDEFDFLRELNPVCLGIEEKVVSASFYRKLEETLPDSCICSGDGLAESLRAVKDEQELETIAKAEALGDRCFAHMLDFLKPGVTEQEAALEIEFFFRRNGASRLSFPTISIFGEKTSLPHGEPGNRVLCTGDFITMDFGCVVDDYCSDMTRTVACGAVSTEMRTVYEVVLEAQLAACGALKPGLPCREADRAARSVIEKAGYGQYFGHGLGHGVGLQIHEAPTLNPGSDEILAENMAVTIEPGIYLPKKFGIRIEDLAFVTKSGIILTAHSPKELITL